MSNLFGPGKDLGGNAAESFDPAFAEKLARHLNDPLVLMALLQTFKEYMVQYLALNQPPLSIDQIFGFSQFTAKSDFVVTNQNTTSATYTDLATVGPSITGVADGQYLLLFGAQMLTSDAASNARMAVSVNAATPVNDDSCSVQATVSTMAFRGVLKSLDTGGNNTLTAKYLSENGVATATFLRRQLFALSVGTT